MHCIAGVVLLLRAPRVAAATAWQARGPLVSGPTLVLVFHIRGVALAVSAGHAAVPPVPGGSVLQPFDEAVPATGPRRCAWRTRRRRLHRAASSHTRGILQACDTGGTPPHRDWQLPASGVPRAGSAGAAHD